VNPEAAERSQSRIGSHFQSESELKSVVFCLFIIINSISFSVRFKYVNQADVEVFDNSKDEISADNAALS
jgi:hypothetical protein